MPTTEPIRTDDPQVWLAAQEDLIECKPLRARMTVRACLKRQKTWRHTMNTNTHGGADERTDILAPLFMGCKGCRRFKFSPDATGITQKEVSLGKRPGQARAPKEQLVAKVKRIYKAQKEDVRFAWRKEGCNQKWRVV